MSRDSEWFDDPRDERELTRLELVGLAAEIATVATHVHSRLSSEGQSPRVDKLRERCAFFQHSADKVLSRDADLESLSTSQLQEAVNTMRALQRDLAALSGEGDLATDTMLG